MDETQDILFIILHFVNTLSGHNCYYTEIVKLHLLVPSCPDDRCHVIGESYLVSGKTRVHIKMEGKKTRTIVVW